MKVFPRIVLALGVVLFVPLGIRANGPPFHSPTAFVVGLEGAALRSSFRLIQKSGLGRQMRIYAVPITIPYEVLPNRLVLAATIPFLDKRLDILKNGESIGDRGFGDFALMGKFQILQKDRSQGTTRISLLGAVKFPTGQHDEAAVDGSVLPRTLQLGTGAYDYTGGLVLTHLKGRKGFTTALRYTARTQGSGYRFGSSLKYDLAFAFRVLPRIYETYPTPQFNTFLELNAEAQQKSLRGGQALPNSGGTTMFLSPGLQYIFSRTWIGEISVQIPIIQHLHGMQLESDYAYALGFRWLIG